MSDWYIGVDFGQSRDYTAIAIVERVALKQEWDAVYWRHKLRHVAQLRFLERLPLGTSYPDVVDRVAQVARSPWLAGKRRMAVDATGVGRPVVDLLRRANPPCDIFAATVTSGETETSVDGGYRVPKRDLITRVQLLLQDERLQIAAGMKFSRELVEEMMAMQVKVSPSGNELMAAWREGTHDDLVFAVALACWLTEKVGGSLAGSDG